MKSIKSLPVILFAIITVLFSTFYIVMLAYAHGTAVDVSTPGITWRKYGTILEVATGHGYAYTSNHWVNVRIDYAHSVPGIIYNNGTAYTSGYSGSGTLVLYSSNYCSAGNHTIFATSDIEADLVSDNAYNSTSFTF